MDQVSEAPDVRDQVIVEVKVGESSGQDGQTFNFRDAVLAEAEAGYGFESREIEGRD